MREINTKKDAEYAEFAKEALGWFKKNDRLRVSYSRSGTFKEGELIAIRNDCDYSYIDREYKGLNIVIIKLDEYEEPVLFPDSEVKGWE